MASRKLIQRAKKSKEQEALNIFENIRHAIATRDVKGLKIRESLLDKDKIITNRNDDSYEIREGVRLGIVDGELFAEKYTSKIRIDRFKSITVINVLSHLMLFVFGVVLLYQRGRRLELEYVCGDSI